MYYLEENKIIFEKNFNFKELELIGCGANSKVYKIKVNNKCYALKVFNIPSYWNRVKFEQKLDLNIPSFITPIKICCLNNSFIGYLMEYCNGRNLLRCNLDIGVEQFIKYSDILLKDTILLSESKFLIQDLSKSNIIYDDGFKVIDTDFYMHCSNWCCNNMIKNKNDILKYNQRYVLEVLVDVFIRNANIKALLEEEKINLLKTNFIGEKISLKEFFIKLCDINDYRNITIKEVGKKLIKKY